QGARGLTYSVLERGGVSEVATGQGVAATQLVDGAGEGDLSPAAPGPGTEVDDVIGDEDRPRLVFDDEDGVALLAQRQQQIVQRPDVVRVQTDRRFVEDIRDIGQRRTEMADELDPLGIAAGQGTGRTIEGQVAEADVGEGPHIGAQRPDQRTRRRVLDPGQPVVD